MTFVDEQLAVTMSRARARFLEDAAHALKEAKPSKSDIEEALQEQIGHGTRLVEMGEAACYHASVARLRPDTRAVMEEALIMGERAFRDLQQAVADWSQQHGVSLENAQLLGPLIAEMDRYRAELVLGSQDRQGETTADHAAFPRVGTGQWGRMNRRRAELIRKNIRGELSEQERKEYETLQRLSLAAVDASFPPQGDGESRDEYSESSPG
jgi:hypothetical protein